MKDAGIFTKRKEETTQETAVRFLNAVSDRLKHFRNPAGDPVPLSQNWILWALSWAGHPYFKYYEYYNGCRAIKRGFGFCSQYAIVLWYYLRRAGILSAALYFDGHVVNQLKFKTGEEWLLDADYRVIIPHSLEDLRNNPAYILKYYQVSPDRQKELQRIFQSKTRIHSNCNLTFRLYFENLTYILRWALPIGILYFVFLI